ncbi:hypothetical protein ABZ869_06765 [Streptomyces sp. NPDC046928]|uniref:hypothetical protein n=1 Tax=Streptomyces sp. NPDC046928 TaxID=3155021 RepID=UPI0033E97199
MTTACLTPSPPRSRRSSVRLPGPAFVAAIASVDPGNLVTNVTAGAESGTALLWVVVWRRWSRAPCTGWRPAGGDDRPDPPPPGREALLHH